jgi:aromatic ring-opening dioxygenase LigB subunit
VGRRVVKDQGFGWKKKEYAKLCLKFGWKRILKYANKRHIIIFICAEVIEKKMVHYSTNFGNFQKRLDRSFYFI